MNRNLIKLVRFKNSDTIICSLSTDNTDDIIYYVLERPMQINMMPVVSKKGIESMTIFMQEWMEYSKDNLFKIPADVVMLIANPEEELIDEYIDALEKNDMHRIQRQFEDISNNYTKNTNKKDDKYSDLSYNDSADEDYDDEEFYEDEDETGRPEDAD